MNVYDFDKTVFRGDSSARFYAYCFLRTPRMVKRLPRLIYGALFVLPKDKQRFKEETFRFLTDLDDPEKAVRDFWKKNIGRVKRFYLASRKPDDVIASASPEFLLRPALDELGVSRLIASPVDARTGRYSGPNCHGEEKVIRFRAEYPSETVDNFYSDSYSDEPMARLAARAWLVKGEKILPWKR